MIRVFVNGFGTIGKRVAFAVKKQDDLELVGVAKKKPDFKAYIANKFGIPLYVLNEDQIEEFENHGIKVNGVLGEALENADIIVDAAPKGVGAKNKELYLKFGKRAIFQGGESHDIVEVSFTAQANYRQALGKRFVRVVSCNTTAMARVLSELRKIANIRRVRGILVRRAADPWETKKGPIDAIVPSFKIPSHHAPDVKTVLGDLNIITLAVVVPTTRMHLHILNVEFDTRVDVDSVIDVLESAPRILIVPTRLGLDSTATIIELARDLGRERNDWYEVLVFSDGIRVHDNERWIEDAVHQEAVVGRENSEAIRGRVKIYEDGGRSIEKTDRSLGILRRL